MRNALRIGAGRGLALVGALFFSGCYTYVPAASVPAPGSNVRVLLPVETRTITGAVRTETLPLNGMLLESGDSIRLVTRSRQQAGNFQEMVLTDTVNLPMSRVADLQVRELSRSRTAGFVALLAAGVAGAAWAIAEAGGGGDGGPFGGGGGNGASITVGGLFGFLGTLTGGR